MEIFKIAAIGVTCAIIIIYLKNVNGELASIATVCAGVLLLSLTAGYVADFLSIFTALGNYAELGKFTIKIVIKIVGISYLVEFTSDLSDKIVFAGRILILTTAFPIIEKLISTVTELL